jgi:hypothetical protein
MPDRLALYSAPLSQRGRAGALRIAIAWILAPAAIVAVYFPYLWAITLILTLTAILVMGVAAATAGRESSPAPRADSRNRVIQLAPLLIATPAVVGYVVAELWQLDVATVVGGVAATALAVPLSVATVRN